MADKKTKLNSSRIDLSLMIKQQMVELLNGLLADSLDLFSQIKQAHWNVKGMSFISLHKLFDDVAGTVLASTDTIAERAVQLGGTAKGTARMAVASSTLPEYPTKHSSGKDHVKTVADRLASFTNRVREGIDAADEIEDAVTADILTEIAGQLDKQLWFVEAHLD